MKIDSFFTEILRKSSDIAVIGNKSRGKSTLAVFTCYYDWLINDALIFSNLPLNFPHIFVSEVDELVEIKNKYPINKKKRFLGDDFENWFSNRSWK